MSLRRKAASLGAALATVLLGTASAHAAFVPALSSPYPTGAPTRAMTVVDADRNGTVDAVAGLRLLRGDGTGRLVDAGTIGGLGPIERLSTGDLNGDAAPDFAAVVGGTPRRIVTFTAVSGAGYTAATVLADADAASDVAIANLNGDGLADLVVSEASAGANVTVLVNLAGMYAEDSFSSGLPAPRDVAVGDLTGDAVADIAVAGGSAEVATLVNVGNATFAAATRHPTGTAGQVDRLTLTQLDGDGIFDAVVADSGAAAVSVLRGNGAAGFASAGSTPTGLASAATSLDASDMNGDGVADVVAGGAGGQFSVLLGVGSAGLSPMAGTPFGNGGAGTVEEVSATDMNRDGQPDVVTANGPGSVSVMLSSATGLLEPQPASIGFGTMPAATPETRTGLLTLRSVRGRLRITRVELQGPRAFSIAPNGCVGRTLLLGQSCSMTVGYTTARRAGLQEALVSVDANAAAVVVPVTARPRAPILDAVRLKPRKAKPGARLKLGYRLSEAARVRVLVQQRIAGRRVDDKCVAHRRANRKQRRCTRWVTLAKIARSGDPGRNVLRPRARARGRKLAPGTYRLSVSAADRFRNRSKERRVKLRIVQAAARRAK